ncbi:MULTISPECIES: hypothetical protein [Bacillus]|uniref:hypothetical protein n=1 Tax=Bacillus TaxID=1386 RepID=UPI000BB8F2E5|nr:MULTISPECIES: hypothetical protein [Bacillus]
METFIHVVLYAILFVSIISSIYGWFKVKVFFYNKIYIVPFLFFQIGTFLLTIAVFIIRGWTGLDVGIIGFLFMGIGLISGTSIYIIKKLKGNM